MTEGFLPPHALAIGMEVIERSDGRCVVRLPYADHLVGDPDTGVLHGGVLTAILDNASGMAVRDEATAATSEPQASMATLDLRIDYMRPAEPNRDVTAAAECYRRTTNVAFVRAVAYHDDPADPIATSVATFMIGTSNTARP